MTPPVGRLVRLPVGCTVDMFMSLRKKERNVFKRETRTELDDLFLLSFFVLCRRLLGGRGPRENFHTTCKDDAIFHSLRNRACRLFEVVDPFLILLFVAYFIWHLNFESCRSMYGATAFDWTDSYRTRHLVLEENFRV